MADSDKARAEPESPESEQRRDESEVWSSGRVALAIGMIIVSLLCGALAWALIVFGVWPGVFLLLMSAIGAWVALWQIRKHSPSSSPP